MVNVYWIYFYTVDYGKNTYQIRTKRYADIDIVSSLYDTRPLLSIVVKYLSMFDVDQLDHMRSGLHQPVLWLI